jgi:hypothetical protein
MQKTDEEELNIVDISDFRKPEELVDLDSIPPGEIQLFCPDCLSDCFTIYKDGSVVCAECDTLIDGTCDIKIDGTTDWED